jgi:hypothetical protein
MLLVFLHNLLIKLLSQVLLMPSNDIIYDPKSYDFAVSSSIKLIESSVSHLCSLIDTAKPSTALCYSFPELSLDEEKDNRLAGKSNLRPIEVTVNDNLLSAATSVKKAYKDFYSHEKTSSKSTFRLPGLLIIDDEDHFDAILSAVNNVNIHKAEFSRLASIPDNDISQSFSKDEYFVEQHKYLVKLQVSRRIKCFNLKADYSIGFHWADKPLSSVVRLKELIDKVRNQISVLEKGILLGSRNELKIAALNNVLERLAELPADAELRERRPIQTQPSVNIRLLKTEGVSAEQLKEMRGDKEFKANSTCPIPFIVLSSKKFKLSSHLVDYTPKELNLTANGKYRSIDERMNIYQKLF